MHENERHLIILSVLRDKPVATVRELVEITNSSEATIRRDISTLHARKKLRKIRGGVEALHPPTIGLAGRPYDYNSSVNINKKRAIAQRAVELCEDNDDIIINGGTTTFQMVHYLTTRRMQVFTNSFPIADHLLHHSKNTVVMPGGTIYREQNIILSPFENDGSKHFSARRMFMGAQGISERGIMEADPLVVQAEEKLINQADELVVLIDSTKFERRTSMVVCPLSRVTTVITDDNLSAEDRAMLEQSGVEMIIVKRAEDGVDAPRAIEVG